MKTSNICHFSIDTSEIPAEPMKTVRRENDAEQLLRIYDTSTGKNYIVPDNKILANATGVLFTPMYS